MNKNQKGFTLIELMIVGAIVFILANVIGSLFLKSSYTKCIAGYQFVISDSGDLRQIFSEEGKGIPCEKS